MKLIMMAITLTSAFAIAETGTFTVKGMHCSGCKETVTKNVCGGEAGKDVESCTVNITNEKTEIGEVVIVTKAGTKINVDAVKAGVTASGNEYKLAKVEIKEMIAKDLKEEGTTTAATGTPETVTTTTTVETKSTGADGKPVVKTEKTKKIIKKMAKKGGETAKTEKSAVTTTGEAPATTTLPATATTPETK